MIHERFKKCGMTLQRSRDIPGSFMSNQCRDEDRRLSSFFSAQFIFTIFHEYIISLLDWNFLAL